MSNHILHGIIVILVKGGFLLIKKLGNYVAFQMQMFTVRFLIYKELLNQLTTKIEIGVENKHMTFLNQH